MSTKGKEDKRLQKILSSNLVADNENFTKEQIAELYEIFVCFEDKYTHLLNFRDMISSVSTLGLLDKNPIIERILIGIDEEYQDEDMTFDVFLQEISSRLGHPSHQEGRETLFNLIDQQGTGSISFEDLQSLAQQIGYSVTDDEINDIIEAISKEGEISYDEFERHMSRRYK